MIRGILLFVVGVVVLQWQPELPALAWSLLVLPLAVSLRYSRLARYPLWFVAGFFWALIQAHWMLASNLPTAFEGVDLEVDGVIASLPERRSRYTRFNFKISQITYDGEEIPSPGMVRLGWYNDAPELRVGEQWHLRVRLKRPHGFVNPGGFDFSGWLFRMGIRATGYVREMGDNQLLDDGDYTFALQRLRQHIRELVQRAVPGTLPAAMVNALAIGDRSDIDRATWDMFAATGTSHLVAISGLHIGIVAGLAYFLLLHLWRRIGWLTLRVPAQQGAAVAALLAAATYAALAGFAVPTQRALIMLTVLLAGRILRRAEQPSLSLAVALFVVVLWDPLTVLSVGFWLSFVAVAVIMYGVTGRYNESGLFWKWGRVQWLVTIGLAPLLIASSLKVSLAAPLVNLLAVPLFSFIVVPLVLLGLSLSLLIEPVGFPLLVAAGWLLQHGVAILSSLGAVEWLSWVRSAPPFWVWLPALFGILILLMPRGLPARWLALLLLSPLVLMTPKGPPVGALWFTLLDVGDGIAAVVQTANHTLLYDLGPRFSDRFDAGSAVVVPFLRERGITQVDLIIVSHGDMDHQGGLQSTLGYLQPASLMSGEPERIIGHDASPCATLEPWSWDGVDFEILHPAPGHSWSGNDASCVLRVANEVGSILLPGDIRRRVEARLVAAVGDRLDTDIVVVPHHGSKTSSSLGFVHRVRPSYSLASSGYRSRHGFPRKDVVARWEGSGATLFTTADSGAIEFRLAAGGVLHMPTRLRHLARRYWMD